MPYKNGSEEGKAHGRAHALRVVEDMIEEAKGFRAGMIENALGKPYTELSVNPDSALVFLKDPDENIRANCVMFLASCDNCKERYISVLRDCAVKDSSPMVRGSAVSGLGLLNHVIRDKSITRFLYKVLMDDNEADAVRKSAYLGVLASVPAAAALRLPNPAIFNRETDVIPLRECVDLSKLAEIAGSLN
jgi:hypothetical protein